MTVRALAALVLFVLVHAVCATTHAQRGPTDVVVTRSGERVEGTIREHVAGDHVTIVLADGSERIIVASDIASIELASDALRGVVVEPVDPTRPLGRERSDALEREAPPPVEAARASRGDGPRLGLSAEGGVFTALSEFAAYSTAWCPTAALQVFLDVTLGRRGELRIGLVADVTGAVSIERSYDRERSSSLVTYRQAGLGLRVMVGLDVLDWLTLRIGNEGQAVLVDGDVGIEVELRIDAAVHPVPASEFELGLGVAAGTTPNVQERSGLAGTGRTMHQHLVLPILVAFVGGVL